MSCINNTFIVLDWDKEAFLVKHGPVTPENVVYPFLKVGLEMGEDEGGGGPS